MRYGAAMAHTVHQLTRRSPGRRCEGITSLAKVVEVDCRQASLGQRTIPHPAAEVAVPQKRACRDGKYERVGEGWR
jgi:hypothetical protein